MGSPKLMKYIPWKKEQFREHVEPFSKKQNLPKLSLHMANLKLYPKLPNNNLPHYFKTFISLFLQDTTTIVSEIQ